MYFVILMLQRDGLIATLQEKQEEAKERTKKHDASVRVKKLREIVLDRYRHIEIDSLMD